MKAQEDTKIFEIKRFHRKYGKTRYFSSKYDFGELGVQPGGLLESVLRDLPSPISKSYSFFFFQVIQLLTTQKKALRILSLPISQLQAVDIQTLFTLAEEIIQSELVDTGRYKNGSRPSVMFRRVMKYLTSPLGGGMHIADVQFASRFSEKTGYRPIISESIDHGCDDPELSAPISALKAADAEELQEKALNHLRKRKARMRGACLDVIAKYHAFQKRLSEFASQRLDRHTACALEDRTLSEISTINILSKLSPDALIHFYVQFFDTYNLTEIGSYQQWVKEYGEFPFADGISELSIIDELGLAKSKHNRNKSPLLAALVLSRFVMPPMPIMCARHLFQMEFDWNIGTCNSVEHSMISETPDGYHIDAIKPKTSQAFSGNTSGNSLNCSSLHRVVSALVDHSRWLSNNWARETDSIFVSLEPNGKAFPEAVMFLYQQYNEIFSASYSLPRFTAEQLRDQGLNEFYMSTHDIHALKARAGWDSIATTDQYLGQTIIRILSEANMNTYMAELAKSIIWAAKGDDYLKRFGIDPDDVNRKLLFPINSDATPTSNVADEWLSDQDTPILLNDDRIRHTYRQSSWYRANWQSLLSSNEARFMRIHLPRIIVCMALEKLIENSEYAHLYAENGHKND
ncbi:MAG: hypothetical protein OQL11_11160 [Gammaproteobacteria bacterium]|nr:hypothetical protein [Gammaproteobacteria bacterium]